MIDRRPFSHGSAFCMCLLGDVAARATIDDRGVLANTMSSAAGRWPATAA